MAARKPARRIGRRILKRLALFVAGLLLAVLVGGGAFYGVTRYLAKREAEAILERVRERGDPVTPEECAAHFTPDPARVEREFSEIVQEVCVLDGYEHYTPVQGLALLPPPGEPFPPLVRQTIQLTVAANADVLEWVREAPADFVDAEEVSLDALLYDFPEHLPAVRAFCRLTSIASLDALAAGDGAGAVDAVLLTLKAGNALRESPKAVTYLVRLACLGMAEEQAHYLVRSGQCAPGDYLRLSRAFGEAYAGEQVRRCAAAERVRTLDSLDDLPAVKWYAIRSGLEGYETFEAMLEADAAERRAYARGPLGGGPFSHFLPEGGGPALALSLIDPMGKEILQQEAIEVKELPRLLTAHLGMAARMRAAEAAAAAAAYRADQGRLPPALETLTPDYLEAVPEDPYIGEPLRYVVEGARFYVYAVHLDGEDDSGRADAHRGRYGEGDVGLTRDDWMRERGARTWRGLAPSPSL